MRNFYISPPIQPQYSIFVLLRCSRAMPLNNGPSERDHELLVAAARAVLASLREPVEQRALPRAAIGALRMLEAALAGEPPPARKR